MSQKWLLIFDVNRMRLMITPPCLQMATSHMCILCMLLDVCWFRHDAKIFAAIPCKILQYTNNVITKKTYTHPSNINYPLGKHILRWISQRKGGSLFM